LRTWIMAKTLWDPSYDTDRAIDEFLDGYYEQAAMPLRRYIDLIHGKAKMDGVHFRIYDPPTSPLFSDDVMARVVQLFDDAEKAVADKPAVLHRVKVARLPIQYVQIARLRESFKNPAARTTEEMGLLKSLFEQFDAVARKEGVSHIRESRRYEIWADELKNSLTPK